MSAEASRRDTEHARARRRVSVFGYLAVLFAVAFLLLLVAYFQQRRSSSETNDALKQSVSAVSAIEAMMEDNDQLRAQVAELEAQVDQLQSEKTELDSARRIQNNNLSQMSDQLAAMDYLWRIQRYYSRGAYDDARALTDAFEDSGLPASLPRENPSEVDGVSPMDQYNALLDAMDYREEP